jgi:hypothetical protein
MFDRAAVQPLELVGSYMQMQARWIAAAADAADGPDFAARLEAAGVFTRIDGAVEPSMFRGATISRPEVDSLATIERVVRMGRVRRIGTDRVVLTGGDVPSAPGQVFVDCTAAGIPPAVPRPVFSGGRVTLQYVTVGIVPWSAATIGTVEASRADDDVKNRLCPPLTFTGDITDVLTLAYTGMTGTVARSGEPDLAAWNGGCRLNPTQAAAAHADDPQVVDAYVSMGATFVAALQNLGRHAAAGAPTPAR